MTIDRALATATALSIALVLLIGGSLVIADERSLLYDAEKREIEKTAVVLTTAMNQAATLSATHSELLSVDPNVIRMMTAGARDELQAYSKPIFDRLRGLAGIDVMHFHDATMKSFLRVWEPANFGQDLSSFRPMVVATNHSHQTQKGLEVGIKGLSLRAVSAIMDGPRLVGTVETGVRLQSLADLAKAATGGDYALVLDPQLLKGAQPSATGPSNGLVLDAATDRQLFERILGSGVVHLSHDSYQIAFDDGNRTLGVQGKPLIDYSGNVIGTILTTCDFTALRTYANRSLVTIIGVSLAGLMLMFAVIMVTIRVAVIRPLRALSESLEAGQPLPASAATALSDFRRLFAAVHKAAGTRGAQKHDQSEA